MSQTMTRPDFRRGIAAAAAAEAQIVPEVTRLTRGRSANRFPGTCLTCGGPVAPGEGITYREANRWIVEHEGGACPFPVTVESIRPKVASRTGQVYTGALLPGIYTMVDANGRHETYRVRVQGTDESFAPGETIIDFLSGPDNVHDYTSFAFLKTTSLVVWKRFRDNPQYEHQVKGALALLRDPERAEVARTCIRCNALLTTPDSIESGMGPTCRDKGW